PVVLVWRCGQQLREQVGADHDPARIDSAFSADALEFCVEGVECLLDSVGEAPGNSGQPYADAAVLAAYFPLRLLGDHEASDPSGRERDQRAGIVALVDSSSQPRVPRE